MSVAWPLADQKLEQELLDLVQSSQRKLSSTRPNQDQFANVLHRCPPAEEGS
jgi:hypothetical protein